MLIHIPCACKERLPSLWATLASLAAADLPASVHIRVSYNRDDDAFCEPNDGQGVETWASVFGNDRFSVVKCPGMSVAAMYVAAARFAYLEGFSFMLKVDDDCLFTGLRDYVNYVFRTRHAYTTFNFWDILNTRKYDDYRVSVPYTSAPAMVANYGERTLWCHRWVGAPKDADHRYSSETKVNASMFAVSLGAFINNLELCAAMGRFRPGQRGMDLCMASGIGPDRFHYFNTYATHLGVFRPQLDGKYWTEFVSKDAEIPQSGNTR